MSVKEPISLDRYAGAKEAVVVRRLVRVALAKGWTISVNDGGEWTVRRSAKRMDILSALATADADTLLFRDAEGTNLGRVMLVYQGGQSEGEEVICDYSDNCDMNALVQEVTP